MSNRGSLRNRVELLTAMRMFRLWQPHEDAYMLAWNAFVANHTCKKLAEKTLEVVVFKAGVLWNENGIDPGTKEHWPLLNYFTSLALADEGIYPILDRSPAKWFWLVNPFAANARLLAHFEEIGEKVAHDLWAKHGVSLEGPTG